VANIDIRQEQNSTELIVVVFVLRCLDRDCNNSEDLLFDRNTFGTVELNSRHTLSITFDGRTTFVFGFDNKLPLVFSRAPAVVAPAVDPLRVYGTSVSLINPNARPPEEGFIAATFANLVVNGRPYEDPKDDRRFHRVRRVANGRLELEVAGMGTSDSDNVQNALFIAYPESVNAFRADVTLRDFGITGTTFPQVRIGGAWFNTDSDSNPVEDERKGDIIAQIILRANDRQVVARLFRCEDNVCSDLTEIFRDDRTFGELLSRVVYGGLTRRLVQHVSHP
jgi:hypothetical protein